YELLALHADTREQALHGFADLALGHDVDPQRIASAWRHALLALGSDEQALAQRRLYLARFPTDSQMREEVAQIEAEKLTEQQLENDPGVQLRRSAERSLEVGALAQAESELSRSLQLRPDDGETIGLLGLLRLRQGRSQEALALFEQASEREKGQPELRARWRDLTKTAHYWSAISQARAQREAGDLEGAARVLEAVRDTQPDQVEAIYLLASLRVAQKRDAEAEALYREQLRRDAADPRAWRGLLSLRMQQGRVEEALDRARELPLAANLDPAQVLEPTTLRDAINLASADHPDVQMRLLERSIELVPRDPWLRYDLARLYLRLQLPGLGQQVMEQGEALAPEDAEMHYAAALVAAARGHDDEALATVQSIPVAQRSEGMRALVRRLQFEGALRRARSARAASDPQQDAFWRNEALAQAGNDAARWLRVARADLSADDVSGARALIDRLAVEQGSLAAEQRRSLAGLMIDAGRTDLAQALLDQMASEQPQDPQTRTQVTLLRARLHRAQRDAAALHEDFRTLHDLLAPEDIELHIDALGLMDTERSTAHEWMAELLRAHPQDPQVLLEAARQAESDRQYAAAVGYLGVVAVAPPQATPASPIPLLGQAGAAAATVAAAPAAPGLLEDSPQAKAQRELAAIEARRQPQVDTAWLQYSRSATDGLSTLRGTEIPLLVMWPGGYDGHWFGQLDAVQTRAGTLPAQFADSSQFGKVQALAPAGLAEPVSEQAQGFSAEFGWRGDQRRFDLGVVGAGFKVPNLVGAWRES
ncbi:MAG TPA: tetratricopeptide repeat protein, partial [Burkholderiaceae bacterium]|nr:tetratricopeptide repeat protein [Burkholderiaceae bacterium]